MRDRLRHVARLIGPVVITVAFAGAAGAAAIYVTGPNGLISCVPSAAPASPDPIPRWVVAAGIPAVAAAFIGAFFALGARYVLGRLIGMALAAALGAGTFYAVYTLLPAACRP